MESVSDILLEICVGDVSILKMRGKFSRDFRMRMSPQFIGLRPKVTGEPVAFVFSAFQDGDSLKHADIR